MKKPVTKLALRTQIIRTVTLGELPQAAGGWIRPPLTWSCPQPSMSGCCPKTE